MHVFQSSSGQGFSARGVKACARVCMPTTLSSQAACGASHHQQRARPHCISDHHTTRTHSGRPLAMKSQGILPAYACYTGRSSPHPYRRFLEELHAKSLLSGVRMRKPPEGADRLVQPPARPSVCRPVFASISRRPLFTRAETSRQPPHCDSAGSGREYPTSCLPHAPGCNPHNPSEFQVVRKLPNSCPTVAEQLFRELRFRPKLSTSWPVWADVGQILAPVDQH